MKVFFKYLIIAFVFASYFQSALEINNDYISNTFNDEYDTYIHSEDTSSQTIIKAECQTVFALLPENIFYLQTPATEFYFIQPVKENDKLLEQKLFLKNCSLLI